MNTLFHNFIDLFDLKYCYSQRITFTEAKHLFGPDKSESISFDLKVCLFQLADVLNLKSSTNCCDICIFSVSLWV